MYIYDSGPSLEGFAPEFTQSVPGPTEQMFCRVNVLNEWSLKLDSICHATLFAMPRSGGCLYITCFHSYLNITVYWLSAQFRLPIIGWIICKMTFKDHMQCLYPLYLPLYKLLSIDASCLCGSPLTFYNSVYSRLKLYPFWLNVI